MPWNDKPESGPWGKAERQKPKPPAERSDERPAREGPPQLGPDLDELTRELRERFGRALGGPRRREVRLRLVLGLVGLAVAAWAASGVYVVGPDQAAVVTRAGAEVGETGPGLHYHPPWPLARAQKVSVGLLNRFDIGAAPAIGAPQPNLMLTSDQNLVDVSFSVQWRVADPAKFLFGVADLPATLKMVAESAMQQAVGRATLSQVMAGDRSRVEADAAGQMQQALNAYGAGVFIVGVQIRRADPPPEALSAFRDIANAGQDARTSIAQAEAYRDKVVAAAKSEAARSVLQAQTYSDQLVREAQGEAQRFAAIDAQYRNAPAVTRQRLYYETIERVLASAKHVVVDDQKGAAGEDGGMGPSLITPEAAAGHAARAPQPARPAQQVPPPAAVQLNSAQPGKAAPAPAAAPPHQ